jgi:iron complex transport system permease protein
MRKRSLSIGKSGLKYLVCLCVTGLVMVMCIALGSVSISFKETAQALSSLLPFGTAAEVASQTRSIILSVRLPRVLSVALAGAALSLSGAAMQGLLKNPLADGSTLGVSSGASLGAVIAIAFGVQIPGFSGAGTTILSMGFAFLSMMLILSLAHRIDYSLSTNTIILVGVIFSMFASSINSLIVAFAGDKVKNITFWTMGSFSGTGWRDVWVMLSALLLCGGGLLGYANELNAFAIGEDNARHVGVNVRRVKLLVMILVSALIGVSVSISGTIGFVGLVIPHMTRMLTGPNHKKLLPMVLFSGACFLMLADLVSRVIFRPLELPIGVVTSFVGSIVFVYIFYQSRRRAK